MDTWDIYFATIVGMSLHPGYNREDTEAYTLEDLAIIADDMMELRSKHKWQSGQPQ